MNKHGRLLILMVLITNLMGCVSTLWTGASLFYDRHNVYKSVSDYYLSAKIQHALYYDKLCRLPNGMVDVTVYHRNVLLSGHLPEPELHQQVLERVRAIEGYRHVYDQITLSDAPVDRSQDSWITAKIRSQIVLDSSIDPRSVSIVTSDRIVYLMGDVRRKQGDKVIAIARDTDGVVKVVKLMRYFKYEKQTLLPQEK